MKYRVRDYRGNIKRSAVLFQNGAIMEHRLGVWCPLNGCKVERCIGKKDINGEDLYIGDEVIYQGVTYTLTDNGLCVFGNQTLHYQHFIEKCEKVKQEEE